MYGQKTSLSSKFQVELMMTKIREYYTLQKDRKSNDVVKEERLLVKLLNSPGRSKLEEALAMEKIVNLLRHINGENALTQHSDS